jgi:ankyrin repeat protein
LHEAVVKDDLRAVQSLLTRMKLAVSKDENGHGLLHKAIYHGHRDIVDWLIEKFPETLEVKDWVPRILSSHNIQNVPFLTV